MKGSLWNVLWLQTVAITRRSRKLNHLRLSSPLSIFPVFRIFPVFANILNKSLPKCKVAHSIRQSCLYTKPDEEQSHVDDYVSENYPLTHYYIKRRHTTSFYYTKNNLIAYYIHSSQENDFHVIPFYDYVRNDYEVILSNYRIILPNSEYDFKLHHRTYVVKAPNRQIYLVYNGSEDKPVTIINASTGILLYNSHDKFDDFASNLFRSMPIANSFVIIVTGIGKEIIIQVIDLVEEKVHEQKFSIEKIKELLLTLSKTNDVYYERLKFIESLDKLYIKKDMARSINRSSDNLFFYDRYVFNISLHLGNDILENVLSIIAVYQNHELTVNFQLNRKVDLITPSSRHEIDFGSTTILTSGKYKVDSRYDMSESRLYSVILSGSDYTLISEPNIDWGILSLYYKNKPTFTHTYVNFSIDNFGNILFIGTPNRWLVFANKDRLIDLSKMCRYYIRHNELRDINGAIIESSIHIADIEVVNGLLLDRIRETNDTKWTVIDITDKVKHLSLIDKLKEAVRSYTCSKENFAFFDYAYYVDCEREEFYVLVCFRCASTAPKRYRVYIFKSKIKYLFDRVYPFRLVRRFETRISKSSVSSILHSLRKIKSSDNMILRLFINKWDNVSRFIGLKVFEIYDKSSAYYDYGYNRRTIRTVPVNTSIASTLHLVRRVLQTREPLNLF